MPTIKRYLPDGGTRAIWDDHQSARERRQGALPQRASRIEVITAGPCAGKFHIDFSLLADATGDDSYKICLPETFEKYGDANRREVEWLQANYVMAGLP